MATRRQVRHLTSPVPQGRLAAEKTRSQGSVCTVAGDAPIEAKHVTVAGTSAQGRTTLELLVRAFAANAAHYKSPGYSETATRSQFIDRLFEALGWDVNDSAGLGPRRDVVVENRQTTSVQLAGEDEWDDDLTAEELADRVPSNRYPDYVFRVDLRNRFVAEAKKPSVNLRRKAPSFQAKSYAWTMRLPVAVLTDFEELRVFDTRYRPAYEQPNAGVLAPCSAHGGG
jgi:adenine-specific DNA-methyltransferase